MDQIIEAITFDDILIVPAYSDVMPRGVDVATNLTPSIPLNVPLVAAPMDTVTEAKMAVAIAESGGVGVIHRNMAVDAQILEVAKVKGRTIAEGCTNPCIGGDGKLLVGGAVGVGDGCLPRAEALLSAHVDFLVVDSAHG
ncbi:MAG: IMP dehydrogenase, partial [Puniceicoccales bacterium]|nr:IMP dehydrogenase [Puniceicoccales bacterium]